MNNNFETVIGLEVHAELNTKTKIFCSCENRFGAEVNTLCCPICMGLPGTLPVLNRQVVESAVRMGHALNCRINGVTKQDRKNYFYPDLPKAYQISQFDVPLCEGGYLDVLVGDEVRRIGVTRIHIEEDAGKLIHDDSFDGTLCDYNRCGVPLIEIVSEPDLRSADEAKAYLETITTILLYLGISDAKMQEGSVRCDVNVSVRPRGASEFGTRCEMKNVNSFGAVYRAIVYEAERQMEVLASGGTIQQETRRWDDAKGKSILMRSKEDAQDYRYFPDPDLLTFVVSEEKIAALKASLPELPTARTLRYVKDFGLQKVDAQLLSVNKARADFFDACAALGRCEAKIAANWLLGDIAKILNEQRIEITDTALTPEHLADMIVLINKGTISNTAAKTVLEEIMRRDVEPAQVVEEKGLAQISDASALSGIVDQVLADNPKAVADYKKGKVNVAGFLVGQCMKASRGQGNPATLRDMVIEAIQKL
ncbi:Asp-tRNA(Asn)/Glu-tRNA(Gln) amidotransferase subunit GatB [Anaerofilum sp. BX8]|uniref:Aspartyl/glutamyl-tRNA(Asn/Gln) amidotransferase subunit B n=1 Tax=Anaerofilum hominis TaxID=2763016 RepID=A0A923KUW8_9FIRM|nr:Asp-tRNA(Asn)/Glu-tRNA(Gln) amidotransferase subunit GatB [Anaerofilum hominis]MBC5580146.1 Asp-tRNA(Asn)/Glu-tRNA(Gln) amidotransferase subunit GatB [Anaerofilum hominis]